MQKNKQAEQIKVLKYINVSSERWLPYAANGRFMLAAQFTNNYCPRETLAKFTDYAAVVNQFVFTDAVLIID